MKLEREVSIRDAGGSGVHLVVEYRGAPCLIWPQLKTEFAAYSPGTPAGANPRMFIRVESRGFMDVTEAEAWLKELDAEVLELARNQTTFRDRFQMLVGTTTIGDN